MQCNGHIVFYGCAVLCCIVLMYHCQQKKNETKQNKIVYRRRDGNSGMPRGEEGSAETAKSERASKSTNHKFADLVGWRSMNLCQCALYCNWKSNKFSNEMVDSVLFYSSCLSIANSRSAAVAFTHTNTSTQRESMHSHKEHAIKESQRKIVESGKKDCWGWSTIINFQCSRKFLFVS